MAVPQCPQTRDEQHQTPGQLSSQENTGLTFWKRNNHYVIFFYTEYERIYTDENDELWSVTILCECKSFFDLCDGLKEP